MKTTKKEYKEEISRMTKMVLDSRNAEAKKQLNKAYGSILDGRLYIHSKATLGQLESLYEAVVNLVSDYRIA